MKRKILSMLLCIAVCISMLPMTAYAEGDENENAAEKTTEKAAIQLGTSGISGPTTEHPKGDETKTYYEPTSYIYFGQNNGTEPIKWRVLRADKANNEDKGMFLLSEYLLGNTKFCNEENNSKEWQGSAAQSWCSKFAGNDDVFLKSEMDAVLSVGKSGQSEGNFYGSEWGKSSLDKEEDKIFFLSASELANHVGNFAGAPGMLPVQGPKETWWLRSRQSSGSENMVGIVSVQIPGYAVDVTIGTNSHDYKARPALNLDLDQVLLTSAAVNGKPTGTTASLTEVGTVDTKEWKLTLRDSSRDGFSISNVALNEPTVSFNYSGAKTNPTEKNEYLSAVIVKDDTVLYYGHLLQLDGTANHGASGTAEVTIPNGVDLTANDTQLLVFNEQCNDDYKTDYSSDLKIVQQEITEIKATIPAPELGKTPAGADAVTFETTPVTPDGSVTNPKVTWYKMSRDDYGHSDAWEKMKEDETFESSFCYSVAITADIPSGYVLSPNVTGSVNNKSHSTNYSEIGYMKNGEFYLQVDFDPALVAANRQLYYNAADGQLYRAYDQETKEFSLEYTVGQNSTWSSSQSKGSDKFDTLTLNRFYFVTDQPVALTIMNAGDTFTIKETSGTLELDPNGGLRITGGSILAGADFGISISTDSNLIIDGGALFATSQETAKSTESESSNDLSKGYAIQATGNILLKNTVLADYLAEYKTSTSLNGIQTSGTLDIENAYVRAGKITAANGIYVRECIEVRDLEVGDPKDNQTDNQTDIQTDSEGKPVAKEVHVISDSKLNYFVIDGRWCMTFNSNGGTWEENTQEDRVCPVTAEQLIQFPTEELKKAGYTFSGWFTSKGTKIDEYCRYTPGTAEDENYKLSPQTGAYNRGGIIPTLYAHWTANTSGGGSYTPVQKPEIQPVSGGKTELSKDGGTLEITPDEGMEIGTVTINGKEVTVKDGKITGLKTGDKVQVTFIAKAPSKAEADQNAAAIVKDLKLTVKTSRTANKNIKATVQMNSELAAAVKELKAAGYKVQYKFYRSIKKASAYERMLIKDAPWYVNTIGDKDTYYYYKVRLAVYDQDGKLIAQTALKQCKAGNRIWAK